MQSEGSKDEKEDEDNANTCTLQGCSESSEDAGEKNAVARSGGGGGGGLRLAWLDKVNSVVMGGIVYLFERLAWLASTHSWKSIAAVTLLTVLLLQGIHRFEEEKDAFKLFTPRDTRAVEEEDYLVDTVGEQLRIATLYVAVPGGNVLTAAGVRTLRDFVRHYQDTHRATYNGVTLGFSDLCHKTTNTLSGMKECKPSQSILSLWDGDPDAIDTLTDADVLDAVNNATLWQRANPAGPPLHSFLSPVGRLQDATGRVVATGCMFARVWGRRGSLMHDKEIQEFELTAVEWLEDVLYPAVASRGDGMVVNMQCFSEMREAGRSELAKSTSFLVVGYILMVGYTCMVLGRSRPRYSHITVAFASILSIIMSSLSAYGFCWFIGLKYNPIVQILVLLLLGIGIDDTFVIMDSWWDFAHVPDMKQRLQQAMAHAGPAITITSITDLVAFLAGSSTTIPALRVFCFYAATGIFLDYVYQVTFVTAVVYLDGQRQEKGRWDLCCCCCCGELTDADKWSSCCETKDPQQRPRFNEAARGYIHTTVGAKLPRLLLSRVGMAVVMSVTTLFLIFGLVGCTKVNMNYNTEWFVTPGHRYRSVMSLRDHYFDGDTLIAHAHVRSDIIDQASLDGQVNTEKLTVALSNNSWVVRDTTSSWLRAFTAHVQATSPQHITTTARPGYTLVDPTAFHSLLRGYLRTAVGVYFEDYIIWKDAAQSELELTYFPFVIGPGPLEDGGLAVDCLNDLRDVADNHHAIIFHTVFIVWESYAIIVREVTRNVGIAGACVFVLVTILSANPFIAFYVILSLGCVDVCLIGYMPWIGVELNSVSVVCIVLAIGLAVDYSVHIACAFLTVKAVDNEHHSARTQRAAYALWKMGAAVMNGGFSTFLAVLPLFFAQAYVFKVFFRMFFLIIFFGLWFGVLVVPVILALVGPPANPDATDLSEEPWTNPFDPNFESRPDDVVPVHDTKRCSVVPANL